MQGAGEGWRREGAGCRGGGGRGQGAGVEERGGRMQGVGSRGRKVQRAGGVTVCLARHEGMTTEGVWLDVTA